MKLYNYDPAPNPRRVTLFLQYKGIELATEQVDIRAGEHFSSQFKAINPESTLPTLQLDDGVILTDVISICLYLESIYPDKPLLGNNAAEQAQIVGWDHKIFLEGIMAVAEILRNQGESFSQRALPGSVDVEQIPALVERGQLRIQAFFQALNTHLIDREFIVGSQLSLADIDALVVCDFAKWVKEAVPEDCQHLLAWYQRTNAVLNKP